MRILLVHNEYQNAAGEAAVVAAERELLVESGEEVATVEFDNNKLRSLGSTISAAARIAYSRPSRIRVEQAIDDFKPDIVHVHNTFPLATPSVFDACIRKQVPVVKTLHNFRLFCAPATFYRDGAVCELCLKANAFNAVRFGCYRGSHLASIPVAYSISRQHKNGTWKDKVDGFIALTEFARDKFIEGGIPAEKISVKPNFVRPDPDNPISQTPGSYALFVGRLVPEKGIHTLVRAWGSPGMTVPLKIAGDGPLAGWLRSQAAGNRNLHLLGAVAPEQVRALMQDAAFLVMPSEWYEGFPMVLVEAFRAGLPVVANRLGSPASIVEHGVSGLLVKPGDAVALSAAAAQLFADQPGLIQMKSNARSIYERLYTPQINYRQLQAIYAAAIQRRRAAS